MVGAHSPDHSKAKKYCEKIRDLAVYKGAAATDVTQISIRAMDKVSITAIRNEMEELYPGVRIDESLYKEDPNGDGWHLVATRTLKPNVEMVRATEVYKKIRTGSRVRV